MFLYIYIFYTLYQGYHIYPSRTIHNITITYQNKLIPYDDDNIYLEYYSGKGFHINYSVYMSYVIHINSSNKA
jgi:hypothetical protein